MTTIHRSGMNFGEALTQLQIGEKISRAGWNGNNMWLTIIRAGNAMYMGHPMQDCIGMYTAQGNMQPGWLPSQADLLATDWCLVTT